MPYRSRSRRPHKPLHHNPMALRQAREAANLTQAALADAVGISPGFLSELESGERGASARTVRLLAVALRIPAKKLERPKDHRCPRCTYEFDLPADGLIPLHRVRTTGNWCIRGGTRLAQKRAA